MRVFLLTYVIWRDTGSPWKVARYMAERVTFSFNGKKYHQVGDFTVSGLTIKPEDR